MEGGRKTVFSVISMRRKVGRVSRKWRYEEVQWKKEGVSVDDGVWSLRGPAAMIWTRISLEIRRLQSGRSLALDFAVT